MRRLDMTDARLFPRDRLRGARIWATHKAVRNATVDFGGTADFDLTGAISSATSVGFQYFTKETEGLTGQGRIFPAPPVITIGGAAQTISSESYVANKSGSTSAASTTACS